MAGTSLTGSTMKKNIVWAILSVVSRAVTVICLKPNQSASGVRVMMPVSMSTENSMFWAAVRVKIKSSPSGSWKCSNIEMVSKVSSRMILSPMGLITLGSSSWFSMAKVTGRLVVAPSRSRATKLMVCSPNQSSAPTMVAIKVSGSMSTCTLSEIPKVMLTSSFLSTSVTRVLKSNTRMESSGNV